MASIENYEVYNARMKQSIYDKLFFIDKIFDDEIDTILDFGCANGELIHAVHSYLPHYKYVGYDIDETMIQKAKEKIDFAFLTSNWDELNIVPEKTIVVLSSLIHEIYSYCDEDGIKQFWDRIVNSGFKYIVIRDMLRDRYDVPIKPKSLEELLLHNIRNSKYAHVLDDFENIWGPISNWNDLKHFIFKYRYSENWDRESHENYLPIDEYELRKKFVHNYTEHYDNSGNLPFLVYKTEQDFHVSIAHWRTHVRTIWKHK